MHILCSPSSPSAAGIAMMLAIFAAVVNHRDCHPCSLSLSPNGTNHLLLCKCLVLFFLIHSPNQPLLYPELLSHPPTKYPPFIYTLNHLKNPKILIPNSEIEMLACTPFNCNGFALHSSKSLSFKIPFQPQFLEVATLPHPPILHPPFKSNIRKRFNPVTASSSPDQNNPPKLSFRDKNPKDINILVVGSTGYIGKFVVTELVKRGFNAIAVARERSGIKGKNSKEQTLGILSGANVCFSDVTNLESLSRSIEDLKVSIDVVVSCLASRSGGVKDSWLIDYTATKNSLIVGKKFGAAHFVLLSAICVQKPLLEFQRAKLKFEAELIQEAELDEKFSYSIVRPTAFFKSLAGQVELVKDGKPYVMFGDGKLCACKPISEPDLASFIADCVTSQDLANRVLPIGGPGDALTPLEQGEMLFRLAGKEPKFLKVPIGIMDFVIGILDAGAKVLPGLEDAAEFGKIGRYYAAESMLVLDEETGEYSAEKTPSYGKDTLEEFFKRVLEQGMAGQELGEQMIF